MRDVAAPVADRPQGRAILALLGLVIVWGLSMPVTKLGLRDFPPLTLVALRYLAAVPCLLPILLRRALPARRDLLVLAALGGLGVGLGQVSQAFGVQLTSAAVATVISATIPIFTVLLAAARLGQAVRPWQALGLAVALGGIGLAAAGGGSGGVPLGPVALAGDALVLVSSLAIAGYYVASTAIAARLGVPVVAAWTSVFGAAVLLVPMGWELTWRPLHPSPAGVGAVLYLGVLTTALGVLVWFHALRALPVRVASASQYLQPLIGVAASAAWFGDPLGRGFLGGTALVLGGIALTARGGIALTARGGIALTARGGIALAARGDASLAARGDASLAARGDASLTTPGDASLAAPGDTALTARRGGR